jgi:hypothetical protein
VGAEGLRSLIQPPFISPQPLSATMMALGVATPAERLMMGRRRVPYSRRRFASVTATSFRRPRGDEPACISTGRPCGQRGALSAFVPPTRRAGVRSSARSSSDGRRALRRPSRACPRAGRPAAAG